jgi:hypothetical protein
LLLLLLLEFEYRSTDGKDVVNGEDEEAGESWLS